MSDSVYIVFIREIILYADDRNMNSSNILRKRKYYFMKYLIPMVLLLVLCSCDRNSPDIKESVDVMPPDTIVNELKSKVSQSGLYRLVRSGGVITDPSTSTGKSISKPVVEHVRTTQRIPLIKGAQMYLQYRIWPLPERPAYADLKRVLKHPEMNLPDGKVATGSEFMIKSKVSVNQAIGFTGYGLDEDYELVEGDWIFEIWYKDKKMIEQKFTTYHPDKEEIAAINPLLMLGNNVVGLQKHVEKSNPKLNWPKITIGGTPSAEP